MSLDIMSKFGVDIIEEVQFKHDDCGKDYKTCAVVYYDINKNEYKATDYVVEGDYSNIKITTPIDFNMAQMLADGIF